MKRPVWYRIVICGVGGQGVLLASRIVCQAAMRREVPVVSGEIRNMAQRGGAVHATVVMGGARSTLVPRGGADAVLALEPMEAVRVMDYMGEQTVAIVNVRPVVPFTLSVRGLAYPSVESLLAPVRERCREVATLDATELALSRGSIRVVNMVMLGALCARLDLPVAADTVERVIADGSRGEFATVNVEAFRAGGAAVTPAAGSGKTAAPGRQAGGAARARSAREGRGSG